MFTQGTANADVLNGGAGDDTLYGLSGNDKLNGNGGNDVLSGDAGADALSGGAGEDYLLGGAGNDTLDGGADADWASYEDAAAGVKVDLNLTTAQNTLGGGTDTLKNIENLYGSAFNDALTGNNGVNYLYGGAGDDSLLGGNGDDHFEGGAGADTINGGGGDDIISYEDGLVGGVSVNLATGVATGHGADILISIEAIWASPYDDVLTGSDGDNYIYGGAGADLILGGGGADVLDGADGADTIVGGAGADYLTGGAGDDLFRFADGDSGVFNSAGGVAAGTTDIIADFQGGTRGTGATNGTGDTLDFGLVQGTSANYIENTAASVNAAATQANAVFIANSALRYVATQIGADTLIFASDANGGEAHNLVTLTGVGMASIGFNNIVGTPAIVAGQVFSGSAAPETLAGGAGADTLIGGAGDDTLTGGAGADLFKIAAGDSIMSLSTPTTLALTGDVILDFEGGSRGTGTANGTGDMLDFGMVQGVATNYLENSASSLDAAAAQANAAFAASSELRYVATQVGTDVKLFASDADGGELHSVVTLKGVTTAAIDFGNIVGTTPAIPNVAGTPGADDLFGTSGADLIQGFGGADTIHSSDGDDTLLGGDGDDLFLLGSQSGLKTINGGAGIDTLDLSGSYPAGGHSVIDLNNTTTVQNAVFEQHIRIVISNVENVVGGAGSDSINGNDKANALWGGAGNDNLSGNGGDDTLVGGLGNDTLVGSAGNDLYVFATGDSGFDATGAWKGGDVILGFGVGGVDSLDFGLVRGTVVNYVENSATSTTAAVLKADAMFHADANLRYIATQIGGDVQLIVSDADGGEAHGLVMLVGTSTSTFDFDSIVGTTPAITDPNLISGTPGPDDLVGTAAPDSIYGGAGNDVLSGSGGADTLYGGVGADVLTGGSGADHFKFALGDSGVFIGGTVMFGTADTITDFETGADVLSFGAGAGATANYAEASPLYLTYADAEAAAQSLFLGQPSLTYVVTQVGANSYLFVDSSGDHSADSVVLLQGVALSGIAASDIV